MEECHDYNCAICIDVIDEKTITLKECKHTFHKYCIQQWYYKSNTCPICRRIIKDMFRVKLKVKKNNFFYTYISLCAELKENKIEFRKIIKEKNKIIINNLTFYQDNIALKDENSDLENDVNNNTDNINLQEINYITDFKEDERLGEVYLTILYSEISKVAISPGSTTLMEATLHGCVSILLTTNPSQVTLKFMHLFDHNLSLLALPETYICPSTLILERKLEEILLNKEINHNQIRDKALKFFQPSKFKTSLEKIITS